MSPERADHSGEGRRDADAARVVSAVVARIRADYPEVPEETVTAMVQAHLRRTAGAPVANYREVLAERDVRLRLRRSGHRRGREPTNGDRGQSTST